ncbi:MAG: hypothetical protein NT105_19455 [Verrucomicrobia bacterium]|nr:hypothetical protein [Verrucomicrobiota bacterium]
MQEEARSQKSEVGRNWKPVLLLSSVLWLLTSAVLLADAPDKVRDLTKARQAERDRAAASVPVARPGEVYRRYFAAMKAGRFPEAAVALTDESLRQMKATLIRALQEAPLDELAKFIREAGFKSAAEIQLSGSGKVFTGWIRSGWRAQRFLQRVRQNEIVSVKETIHDDVCDLVIEFKPAAEATAISAVCPKETVVCEQRDRVWRLKLEIPLETIP